MQLVSILAFAFSILALFLWIFSVWVPWLNGPPYIYPNQPTIGAQGQPRNGAVNEGWTPQEADHRRHERFYWRFSIAVGLAGLVSAVAAAVVATFAYLAVNGQLVAMRDEQRAWISIDRMDFISSLNRDQNGLIYLRLVASLKNSGHTPARYVDHFAMMLVRGENDADLSEIRKHCDLMRRRPIDQNAEGQPIFPGDIKSAAYGVELPTDKEVLLLSQPNKAILIAGCVDYLSGENIEHHQTSFVYELDKPGPEPGTFWAIDYKNGLPIAANALTLAVNPGLAANPD